MLLPGNPLASNKSKFGNKKEEDVELVETFAIFTKRDAKKQEEGELTSKKSTSIEPPKIVLARSLKLLVKCTFFYINLSFISLVSL